jgi:hypothetical protein
MRSATHDHLKLRSPSDSPTQLLSLLLVFGLTLCSSPGRCQVRALAPAASILFTTMPRKALGPAQFSARVDSARHLVRPTYWKEGALLGGAVGGVASGLLLSLCDGRCVLASALLLAIPGAFIGGQLRKPEPESAPLDD